MVGLDLHAEGKAEEGGAKERPFVLIGVHQSGQDPGHKGYSLHLCVVPHLDNLEIVTAEGYGNCAANGHRPAYSQSQKQ